MGDNDPVVDIRPVTGQHTVTKRVLKEFTDQDGKLAVFDRAHQQRRRLSPGAGIFKTTFDSYDSRGTEDRWNRFETSFPEALQRVHDGTASNDLRTAETLRDMLALHWTRSRGMTMSREAASRRFFERHRRTNPARNPDRLAEAFRQRTGLIPSSRAELEWMNEQIIDEFQRTEMDKFHSEQNASNFAVARVRFESLDLAVRYSTGQDLAIGDCPVITTIEGRAGAGPHQDVGILKADHIAMPLTPHALAVLSVSPDTSDLSDDDVARYNALQWSTFDIWIAARPEGTADEGLKLATL